MRFGPVPVGEAVGAVAAHAIRLKGFLLKKGAVVTPEDAAALLEAGITEITAAMLDPGDVMEDAAAQELALKVAGEGVTVARAFTGRANLFAATGGMLVVEREAVDAFNRVDEGVTLATLPAFRPVVAGEMIGTVKIIPFAVGADVMTAARSVARPLVRVAPWRVRTVGVVSTLLPGLQDKVIEKTLRVLEARLKPSGAAIVANERVPHDTVKLAEALDHMRGVADIVIVFGASAITDRRDVIPAALEAAGGHVVHLGMPVDPGNLLMIGNLGDSAVIGAPGCARSPKENGFDWVLNRMLAALPVSREDITGMGVGGLLTEIVTRPQPRAEPVADAGQRIAGLVLAAGRGTRMGGPNKLTAELDGAPLVRHAVETARAAGLAPVVVVTGHAPEAVTSALAGCDVTFVHNPDFAAGMSTSLRAGLAALPGEVDGAVVLLGDMPRVPPGLVRALMAAFDPAGGIHAAVPVRGGHRGNPVLFGRRLFGELMTVSGDVGGRGVLGAHGEAVAEVPVSGDGAFLDVDTPEALAAARAGGH